MKCKFCNKKAIWRLEDYHMFQTLNETSENNVYACQEHAHMLVKRLPEYIQRCVIWHRIERNKKDEKTR